MRPSEPVRHLISLRKACRCSCARRAVPGVAFSRYGNGFDAELMKLVLDTGFAVAAVGGGGSGRFADSSGDALVAPGVRDAGPRGAAAAVPRNERRAPG